MPTLRYLKKKKPLHDTNLRKRSKKTKYYILYTRGDKFWEEDKIQINGKNKRTGQNKNERGVGRLVEKGTLNINFLLFYHRPNCMLHLLFRFLLVGPPVWRTRGNNTLVLFLIHNTYIYV